MSNLPKPSSSLTNFVYSFSDDDNKPREESGVVCMFDDLEASRSVMALHLFQHHQYQIWLELDLAMQARSD